MERTRTALSRMDELPDPPEPPALGPILTCMASVEPQPIRWLWPQCMARGKLSLVFGDPGLGKSFLTLDMAARVTTGTPWPDGAEMVEPGSVILITAEDDIADTIRERLDKARADVSKVYAFEAIRAAGDDGRSFERSFTLADIGHLAEALERTDDCRLVIIDPVSAYLGGKDGHRNDEIRGLLAPLAKLAAEHSVAVVMVTHMSKGGGGRALYRAMGSLAFAAAARSAWLVVRDDARPHRRMFLPAKNNIGNDTSGLAFSLVDGAVAWERSPILVSADQALTANDSDSRPGPEPEALDAATEWVTEMLKLGPMQAATVKEEAKKAGLNYRTVHRAKDKLGVRAYREQFGGAWTWKLPAQNDGKRT